VPAEILDRVFDPFFSTKGEQGTGLGLSISLGLVRGMGGRMWLENVEGGGARVVIEVPREGATALPGSPARGIAAARHLAVLLVEDDEAVRRGTAKMLERLGHVVTTAATYDEARMLLMDPSAPFQALVVDVHLDAAHTGFDLFEDLQVEGSGVERRIVFTTGDSVSVRTRDALAKSERPVLKKPFRLEELREMLDRVASQTAPPPHPA
jgi:CheY-like chemotaxis protein